MGPHFSWLALRYGTRDDSFELLVELIPIREQNFIW